MKRLVLLLVFLPLVLWAENGDNVWKTVLADFENKSENGVRGELQVVIRKSILSMMGKVDYLNIKAVEKTADTENPAVLREYYRQGEDILISGYYRVSGSKIFITARAVDLVTRAMKLEKVYEGAADMDIFDTLDKIAENLKEDITRALPPMEEDVVVVYRKRQIVESEELKLPREFTTKFGLISAFNLGYTGYTAPVFLDGYAVVDLNWNRINFGVRVALSAIIPDSVQPHPYDEKIANVNGVYSLYLGWNFNQRWRVNLGGIFWSYLSERNGTLNSYSVDFKPELGVRFVPTERWTFHLNIGIVIDSVKISDSSYNDISYEFVAFPFSIETEFYFNPTWGICARYHVFSAYVKDADAKLQNMNLFLGVAYRVKIQ